MIDVESPHLRLQQQIDCQLETKARAVLEQWDKNGWKEIPGTDADEAPLKYLALVILDAVEERATRVSLHKDLGVTVYGDTTYSLPKAPSFIIARALEILREIIGLDGAVGRGKLALGIRNDSLELIVQKEAGLHIINIPGIGELSG